MTILSITAAALTLLAFLLCVWITLDSRKRYRKELSDLRSKLWEAMFSGKDTRIRFGFGDAEDSQEIYSKGLKQGEDNFRAELKLIAATLERLNEQVSKIYLESWKEYGQFKKYLPLIEEILKEYVETLKKQPPSE